MPGSSLSRVQGYPQDEGRWRMNERMTRGDQASVSEAPQFIFREGSYTLSCTYSKVKNESQLNVPSVLTFIDIRFLPARVLFFVHYLLARRPVDIL